MGFAGMLSRVLAPRVIGCFVLGVCAASATATVYDFLELNPGGRFLRPAGISNNGIITGSTSDGHGFVMNGTDFRLINVPGAASTALGKINALGTMAVGTYGASRYYPWEHAFLWDGTGAIKLLPDLPDPGNRTIAWDVSDLGTVVGEYDQPPLMDPYRAGARAFELNGDGISSYIVPNTNYSTFHGTNDIGSMVGVYNDGDNRPHGFELNGASLTTLTTRAGFANTIPMDINNRGVIAGYDRKGIDYHGWLLQGQDYVSVDFPAVADRGDTFVTGVNDLGQVVGYYTRLRDYDPHGFLAYPRGTVPEPGTLCLLAAALPCLLLRRNRR